MWEGAPWCGRACQSSSVIKGMKGCPSRSTQSKAYTRTRRAAAAAPSSSPYSRALAACGEGGTWSISWKGGSCGPKKEILPVLSRRELTAMLLSCQRRPLISWRSTPGSAVT